MCMHASFNIKNEIYKLQYFNVKRKFKIKKEGRIEVNIFHIWLLFFCFVLLISKWLTTFIITNGKWMFAYFLIKNNERNAHIMCVCCGWWTWWGKATISSVYDDDAYLRTQRTLNQFSINSHFQYLISTVLFCYHVQKSEKNPKKHRKRRREKKMNKTIKQIVWNACKNKHRLIDW